MKQEPIRLTILGMEHAKVMSMEGMEANSGKSELCGVFVEVERPNCEVGHEANESLDQR